MKPTQTGIAITLALIVIAVFFIFPGLSPFSQPQQQAATNDQAQTVQDASTTAAVAGSDQVQITDEVLGTGATAGTGDTIVVAYTGSFTNGTVFDSSVGKPANPLPGSTCPAGATTGICLTLGARQVISGWEQGFSGMKEGGKRKLVIPASLGYGASGITDNRTGKVIIPPNATLIFEVELLKVAK